MPNIILIEDNTARQQEEYRDECLNTFSSVLYNAIDNKYTDVFNKLKEDVINLPYDVIIVHESAFEGYKTSIINTLKEYCKVNQKLLVFFSGGITSISYNKKAGVLYLPSKVMYTNLMTFLNDFINAKNNVMILAYGENWELNTFNVVYKNIKKFLKENSSQDTRLRVFEKEVQLDLLGNIPEINSYAQKKFLNHKEIEDIGAMIKNIANKKMGL